MSVVLAGGSPNGLAVVGQARPSYANMSAPVCVNFTYVPLSCITSQPRSMASGQSGAVFRRGALVAEQERGVDDLGVDAAILHRLESAGVLQ